MSNATRSSAPARPRSTLAGRASLPGRTGELAMRSRRTASPGPSPSEIVQPCWSAQPCAPTRSVSSRKAQSMGSGARGPSPNRGPPAHSCSAAGSGRVRSGIAGGRFQPGGSQPSAGPAGSLGPVGSGRPSPAGPPPRCSGSCQPLPSAAGSKPSPWSRSRGLLIAGSLSSSSLLGGRPGDGLAVRVARSPPTHGARALLPTGGRRPDNAQPGHDVPADLRTKLAEDRRGEKAQLGGPGCGLGDDEQLALCEGLRCAVRRDLRADQGRPAAEHRADPGALRPVLLGDQGVDEPAEGLRVVGTRAGTGPLPARSG